MLVLLAGDLGLIHKGQQKIVYKYGLAAMVRSIECYAQITEVHIVTIQRPAKIDFDKVLHLIAGISAKSGSIAA